MTAAEVDGSFKEDEQPENKEKDINFVRNQLRARLRGELFPAKSTASTENTNTSEQEEKKKKKRKSFSTSLNFFELPNYNQYSEQGAQQLEARVRRSRGRTSVTDAPSATLALELEKKQEQLQFQVQPYSARARIDFMQIKKNENVFFYPFKSIEIDATSGGK